MKNIDKCDYCIHEYQQVQEGSWFVILVTVLVCTGIWYGMSWLFGVIAFKYTPLSAFQLMYGILVILSGGRILLKEYEW